MVVNRRRQKRAARAEKTLLGIMSAMTPKDVGLHLKTVPKWSKRAQRILRTFTFEGFVEGIDFVNRIARKAQRSNHHPDIDIRFDKVTLKLTAHDEGGLTEKDFSLARQCDEVFSKYFAS
jgi:4a-hydroxytetrahydrobiopterin dehydratase